MVIGYAALGQSVTYGFPPRSLSRPRLEHGLGVAGEVAAEVVGVGFEDLLARPWWSPQR